MDGSKHQETAPESSLNLAQLNPEPVHLHLEPSDDNYDKWHSHHAGDIAFINMHLAINAAKELHHRHPWGSHSRWPQPATEVARAVHNSRRH